MFSPMAAMVDLMTSPTVRLLSLMKGCSCTVTKVTLASKATVWRSDLIGKLHDIQLLGKATLESGCQA